MDQFGLVWCQIRPNRAIWHTDMHQQRSSNKPTANQRATGNDRLPSLMRRVSFPQVSCMQGWNCITANARPSWCMYSVVCLGVCWLGLVSWKKKTSPWPVRSCSPVFAERRPGKIQDDERILPAAASCILHITNRETTNHWKSHNAGTGFLSCTSTAGLPPATAVTQPRQGPPQVFPSRRSLSLALRSTAGNFCSLARSPWGDFIPSHPMASHHVPHFHLIRTNPHSSYSFHCMLTAHRLSTS
ncbi:hypothetical protein B0J18DRAFT_113932 [Chaetomium sp. MPI-SDFR-AT-0129]|nr:hypothetical protein B0J18DRAFT_113932 [Chaetomium sp. MPI-SDFR-AT-0129]